MDTKLFVVTTFAVLASTPALADVVTERGGHWTEGVITVDATPAELYAVATDYAHWPQVFSDITWVKVTGGGRENAKVRFDSRALDHRVTVQFDNIPDRAIRFRGIEGPPGGRARGEYILDPIDGGKRTRVTARLYMDVVGVPGMFVRERSIRPMRQRKLSSDLRDIGRWVAARPSGGQHVRR